MKTENAIHRSKQTDKTVEIAIITFAAVDKDYSSVITQNEFGSNSVLFIDKVSVELTVG